ncbi:MAG: hypothetical protein QGI24_08130 [Kiritimatiellia bacterium]|nr:hypothetical protein [Kiritimatiellia bacterium]MDP6848741.1 hypothetical protein [Kiritimatiellia bacterium]
MNSIRHPVLSAIIFRSCIVLCTCAGPAQTQDQVDDNTLVQLHAGRLLYKSDARGNRIPDFSTVGYMGGGVPIPAVPTCVTLGPKAGGDDTERIQAALDRVSRIDMDRNGFRGALELAKGTYRVSGTLRISLGGVVLRGAGQDSSGTRIIATGTTKRTLIEISGGGGSGEIRASRRRIIDDYVPVGAKSFGIENAEGLEPGSLIVIHRPSTKEWIHELGMNRIPPRRDGRRISQWVAGDYDLRYDRVVTKLEGNRITIDTPVLNSMDKRFGGGFIYIRAPDTRPENFGVEKLLLVSEFKGKDDESHAWNGISMSWVRNSWVRNVTAAHFCYAAVTIGGSRNITIQDCACLDPVSRLSGSRRYSFNIGAQFTLVQRCYARHGRHDFVHGKRVAGPNVFLDCLAEETHSDSGPHHRWSTGTLFDNVKCGELNVRNRGNSGSGHGWAGAQTLFYNCEANRMIVQSPPTALNWRIGCEKRKRVSPRSLYLQQLGERLGPKAVENITTHGQREGEIYDYLRKTLGGIE